METGHVTVGTGSGRWSHPGGFGHVTHRSRCVEGSPWSDKTGSFIPGTRSVKGYPGYCGCTPGVCSERDSPPKTVDM